MSHEIYEILMMKAVDGKLSEEERTQWNEHLQNCEDCRTELNDFRSIKETTDGTRGRILSQAKLDPIRESLGTKTVTSLGFMLILSGSLLLVSLTGYQFFLDPKMSLWIKLGVGFGGSGFLTLFGQVVYRRLRSAPHDPYRNIDM